MFCSNGTVARYDGEHLRVGVLRCKRWTCDYCMPMRLRQLRTQAAEGEPNKLITLTVDPSRYSSADEAARALVHGWRMTRQRAAREGIASDIQYIAVFEQTKKGWPHLHILARAPYIPQWWLSDCMRAYAYSPIVDIRAIKSRRHASQYVAKYVSKGPGVFAGVKRYWRSLRYGTSGRDTTPVHDACCKGWRSRVPLHEALCALTRYGWEIVEREHDWVKAAPTPEAVWLGPRDSPGWAWRPCSDGERPG